jgi:hypothetical protein
VLLLSVSSAFHWSEGRCWPLYRNSRRAHYTEANFAIPAISAPVPQQTAQALAVFARRCVHFFSLTACLFCQRPRTQLTPQTPPPPLPSHAGRPNGGGRRGSDRDRTETATATSDQRTPAPLCCETPRSGPSTQTATFSPPSHATLSSAPSICCTIHSTHHRL